MGVVRGTKTCNYFISSVRKYYGQDPVEGKQVTSPTSEVVILGNGFQSQVFDIHIYSAVLRKELHSCSHDVGISLWPF